MNSRNLLALPYQLARTPLALLDAKVAQRLAPDSPPRLVFDRALGSLDWLAGRVLRNSDIAERGAGRAARADKLATAVTLEQEAAERRRAAADAAQEGRQTVADKRKAAQDQARDGVQEAAATERDGKRAAADDARAREASAKKEAEARKKQRLSVVENERDRAEAVADARVSGARKVAKAKLSDVTEQRNTADAERGAADKLGELADEKKAARKKS